MQLQTSTITIRRMRLGDIDPVHEIDRISFSTPWPRRAYLHELIHNPAGHLWVAVIQDNPLHARVVGMIAIWMIVDEVHIGTLAVHPDYRRQGIAQRLISVALQYAVEAGARTATLEVRKSNIAAQALYRLFDFKVVGRRRGYYRDNKEDALLMTASGLSPASVTRLAAD